MSPRKLQIEALDLSVNIFADRTFKEVIRVNEVNWVGCGKVRRTGVFIGKEKGARFPQA